MLTYMVYIPFWLLLMVSYLLSEVLSSLALLNLFMLKKIADFRKLPFMLKSTLGHLNSIREMMPVRVLQLRQHIEFRNWAWNNNQR